MLRVTSLGSGSKGNATVVAFEDRNLLIDSGFSCKELERRLHNRGVAAESISAILVTHEHSDHFKGVPAFSNKHNIPVWMNHGTSFHDQVAKIKNLNIFNSHSAFSITGFHITPVAVPHDSREACQFVVEAGNHKVGLLTDLGHITPYVNQQYADCDILLLEFNHDRGLLAQSRYPASLKARVGGSLGHLSNEQAAEFLKVNANNNLRYLVAMHVSEENNNAELVQTSINSIKLAAKTKTLLAHQDNGFDWIIPE